MEELRALTGLMILTGVFRASREPLESLFCEDLNFGKPIFRATMPRERMKTILKFLRFDDHSSWMERARVDKLAPIREMFEMVKRSLHSAYNPGTFVTIDQHLCRYRGRCQFLQYMPNKPDKQGRQKGGARAPLKNLGAPLTVPPPPMCPPHLSIPSPVPPSPVQIDKLPDRAPLSDSTGGGPSTLTRGRLAEHWNIFSQHLNLLEGEI